MRTLLLLCLCAPAAFAAPASQPAPATPQKDCGADDDACRFKRLGDERLGWMAPGLGVTEIHKQLGRPESVSKKVEEGATGLWVQDWGWPKKGISLVMSAATKDGPQTSQGITVTAPCALASKRGVQIGSSAAKAEALYADTRDPRVSVKGERLTAGSVYGGLFFDFEGGKVSRMYLGVGAE
jgi:hypothetical protein